MSRAEEEREPTATQDRVVTVAVLVVAPPGTSLGAAQVLVDRCAALGHQVLKRLHLPPDREAIEAQLRAWVAEESIDVVLVAGAIGLTSADVTPEAVRAVIERELPGFGETVRRAHEARVGLRAIHGRELAGVSGGTLVFAISSERQACIGAWDAVLGPLLDPSAEASLVPLLSELVVA